MLGSPGSTPPPCSVQSTTSTPASQHEKLEQPLASAGEGDPVHPSIAAHVSNVPCAPRHVGGMLGTSADEPPSYGTRESPVPRKEMTLIGRDGWQSSAFSSRRSIAAGATAAK